MLKLLKGLLFAFKNNPILPKLKIVVKTSRMLKTNLLGILITVLMKLGLWNKHTEPYFKKLGTVYSYLLRVWFVFNILMVVYFVGTIGPIDTYYYIYTSIKNMFNNFTDFYSKMSQSFIDYLKHIFSSAPKPPKPELPPIGPRPRPKNTTGYFDFLNSAGWPSFRKADGTFFSLRRLYALKDSFNASTGYYDSWYNAIFNIDTIKYAVYCIVLGVCAYFLYMNYENLGGFISGFGTGLYNYMTHYGINIYEFVLSIPNKIYSYVTSGYSSVIEYITNFHFLHSSRNDTHTAGVSATDMQQAPSDTSSFADIRNRIRALGVNDNAIAGPSNNTDPAVQYTGESTPITQSIPLPPNDLISGSHNEWGAQTHVAPMSRSAGWPSFNPASVGLGLTNSQLAGVTPNWADGTIPQGEQPLGAGVDDPDVFVNQLPPHFTATNSGTIVIPDGQAAEPGNEVGGDPVSPTETVTSDTAYTEASETESDTITYPFNNPSANADSSQHDGTNSLTSSTTSIHPVIIPGDIDATYSAW
uniref:hypothetical protein n=1 Tax=Pallidohirschioporus biformis TaxID=50381 RepID=UPI002E7A87B0|nr:hypothetical protein V2724_mgp27 [Pallidohirschioporus biformis]WQA11105.1 hypothetical protein [Pallidohirschioporus biformis]